jgi:hypothetical protein
VLIVRYLLSDLGSGGINPGVLRRRRGM